jgi:hypothetical protein
MRTGDDVGLGEWEHEMMKDKENENRRWCRTRRVRTWDDEGQGEWEWEKFISFENSLREKYLFC